MKRLLKLVGKVCLLMISMLIVLVMIIEIIPLKEEYDHPPKISSSRAKLKKEIERQQEQAQAKYEQQQAQEIAEEKRHRKQEELQAQEQEKRERVRIQEQKELERVRIQKQNPVFQRFEKVIQEWVQNGTIHSITPELNEVRMDPLIWSLMTVEVKKSLMQIFGQYFNLHPKAVGEVVIIRSKYSDEKLANTGFFGGYKIHR